MLRNRLNIFKLMVLVLLFIGIRTGYSQSAIDLRINEYLVQNDSNYVDDFGQHNPWIEIFNTAYNTVDIGGLYLSDDINNPTKYLIPTGQPITKIAPRSFLVLWADNQTTRGILHLNFKLEASRTICLFEADGRTLVDSVKIGPVQKSNVTYGRLVDGGKEWGFLDAPTPNANNYTKPKGSSSEQFQKYDPTGIGMAVIAMSAVFAGLTLLFLFFKAIGHSMTRKERKAKKEDALNSVSPLRSKEAMSGEVTAAIAMVLYLYSEQLHDQENPVITIAKVSKTYSPWSSKIYGLRKSPK